MRSNSTPDWVQPAQQAASQPMRYNSSFSGSSGATEKQKGYLKSILKRVKEDYTPEWLSENTGVPVEQFQNDMSGLGKNEASSVIDILRELEDAIN